MRRFLAFVVLFACSLPVGLSIAGCGHNPNNYCVKNGHAYGITTSQVVYVTLGPEATGFRWRGARPGTWDRRRPTTATAAREREQYTYASSNLLLADVSPTGTICAGTWNRNSPGGDAEFHHLHAARRVRRCRLSRMHLHHLRHRADDGDGRRRSPAIPSISTCTLPSHR